MDPQPYKPRALELSNPFGRDDGWFYFTTGGHIIRFRDGVSEKCASLGERINAVVTDPDGSLFCVTAKGNLHRYRDSHWSKLALGVKNTVDLLRLADGRFAALAWQDDESQLVFVQDDDSLTTHRFDKRFFSAAELPSGEILLAGEGIYRFDGQALTREHDAAVRSLLVAHDSAYAGGAQIGLSGKASLFRRKAEGSWAQISDSMVEDKDLFDLIVFRDSLYLANVLRLGCLRSDETIEIVRPGLARYLGVVNEQLVVCSKGTASAFDGDDWVTIRA
jgi:hypothetical protein